MREDSERPVVDFLIIGAQKAGTTSLHRYLERHPQVHLPDRKEVNFFVREREWPRGLDWYGDVLSGAAPGQLRGEASPLYAMFPLFTGVPERVAAVAPGTKLIYLVRHPIERARSSYLHALSEGTEHRPAHVALRDGVYLLASLYATQLDQWYAYFPPEQIHVVVTEQLASAPVETMTSILHFLEVEPDVSGMDLERRHHKSAEKHVPRGWTRTRLGRRATATLRKAAPNRTARWVERPMRESDGSVSPEVWAELEERIAPGVRRLRDLIGPVVDVWNLSETAPPRVSRGGG